MHSQLNLFRRPRLILLCVVASAFTAYSPPLQPVALRCEYRENPLGLDETRPRLTWRMESDERDQRQTAYRINGVIQA